MGECTVDPSSLQLTERRQRFPSKTYQEKAQKELIHKRRAFLYATMGSGKTRILLETANQLLQTEYKGQISPTLIVCSKSALYVWKFQIWLWLGASWTTYVQTSSPTKRQHNWENYRSFNFIIVTYETLARDIRYVPKEWHIIMCDESHKIRNYKLNNYKKLSTLRSDYLFMATGTPVRRGPQDLWTMLNCINRKVFSSYWRFVHTWCEIEDNGFGKSIVGVKNASRLSEMLQLYMVKVSKEDTDKELPEKIRQRLVCQLEGSQAKLYNELLENMLVELPNSDNYIITSTVLSKIIRLRQLLTTPQLLDKNLPIGIGFDTVVEHIKGLEDPHVFICSFFARALPIYKEELLRRGYKNVFILKGGMHPVTVSAIITEFKQTRGILLCSVGFAQSFSLETCSIGYVIGFDWNADTNEQMEDRLRRVSSTADRINWYYIVHEGTEDERVLNIVNDKYQMSLLTVRPSAIKTIYAQLKKD